MGVYNIYMGKGIIIPISVFVRKYKEQIMEIYEKDTNQDEEEIVKDIVKKYIGDYNVCRLGHDAFEGRHGLIFDIFEETENEENALKVCNLLESAKLENNSDLPFKSIFCSEVIFIGHFVDICKNELSYYLKAPEVIYSLASFIPQIIKEYPILIAKEYAGLNIFDQEANVWTFAADCCCCG